MSINPVIHFEMPAEDRQRVSTFYSRVFGWQMQQMGAAMNNYIVATTTDSDDKGPKQPGAINGGFFPKSDKTALVPSVVIAVDDLKAHIEKVKQAGGQILEEPVEIPGVGWYVSFVDTEGNRVSMLQASRS